ncbi:MAG: serine hydrolase [Microthrixaceae bacterium]
MNSSWSYGPQLKGNPEQLNQLLEFSFSQESDALLGETLAVVVVQYSKVVAERYSSQTSTDTPLLSWSMAKSITHAAAGIMVADGLLDPDSPINAPEWATSQDPRSSITLNHLLEMRSGLHFTEEYVDDQNSNCIEMLFGSGAHDVASYAASQPLEHDPGEVFNYSSGTTNIIARHLAQLLGAGEDPVERQRLMTDFLQKRLFGPLGMSTAQPRFDAAGTFVGSSYLYASAQDFARFGLLYLRDGVWGDERILPEGWVKKATTSVSIDPDDGWLYGQHWWVRKDDPEIFFAHGYEKQIIMCIPRCDTVLVRLGKTTADQSTSFESYWDEVIRACSN